MSASPYRDTATHSCPSCAALLVPRRFGAAHLLLCTVCDGVFVPRATMANLCHQHDPHTEAALLAAFARGPAPTLGRAPVRYRKCPICVVTMTRTQFAKGANVIIDLCLCGVWLDAHELDAVLAFVHTGGMHRAAERIARENAAEARAQGPAGAKFVQRVQIGGGFGDTVRITRAAVPRRAPAIWSVFEMMFIALHKQATRRGSGR